MSYIFFMSNSTLYGLGLNKKVLRREYIEIPIIDTAPIFTQGRNFFISIYFNLGFSCFETLDYEAKFR